ncbi:DegT/DnrJ/EryC1/StrS family aminotransferase [Candidatus Margulisiibacteriota bacterium]
MNNLDIYKKAIFKYLNSENLFFYWKGRVALYAILKAMGIKEGDEVIIPAYTCVVVPNAIIYLGAKPVYVDINPETYNLDIDLLGKTITKKTRVIICQNTYGLTTDLEKLIDIAKKHNLYTIEDCTHGFGGKYNNKQNGTSCDAAFFSTQWNKPFSTGIGGFALINNLKLIPQMIRLESLKSQSTFKEQVILKILLLVRKYVLNKYIYWIAVKLYRFLSKKNLIIGSSQGDELISPKMPKDFFKDISEVQIKEGIKALRNIDKSISLRLKNAREYTAYLKKQGKNHIPKKHFVNHSFLKYPLIVKDRKEFMKKAEKANIQLGDWFLSPIHPVTNNLEKWCFKEQCFPIALSISKKAVNLPTDTKEVGKIINFLQESNNLIL